MTKHACDVFLFALLRMLTPSTLSKVPRSKFNQFHLHRFTLLASKLHLIRSQSSYAPQSIAAHVVQLESSPMRSVRYRRPASEIGELCPRTKRLLPSLTRVNTLGEPFRDGNEGPELNNAKNEARVHLFGGVYSCKGLTCFLFTRLLRRRN